MAKRKNPAAVSLGRKGGKQRAKKLSSEELSAQGKKAAEARWAKVKDDADRPAIVRAATAKKKPAKPK